MRWIALACLLGACAAPDPQEVPVRWLSLERFRVDVQPILAESCGNPSCHGRSDRPLSLYSVRGWRLDPAHTYLPEPLTEEEQVHNYTMSCVFVSEAASPEESLLLLKPLGASADRYHGGGVVFDGDSDRDYRTVLDWIEEGWSL